MVELKEETDVPVVAAEDTAADTAIPGDPSVVDTAVAAPETSPVVAQEEPKPKPKRKPKAAEEERSGVNTVVASDPSSAVVRLTGSARTVLFRSGGKSWTAGSVPAGLYEIWADFGNGDLQIAGKLRVNAGNTYTVNCDVGKGCTAY